MPKSFLVKKVLWNKKKPNQSPGEGSDIDCPLNEETEDEEKPPLNVTSDDETIPSDPKRCPSRASSTCGNISASSRLSNADSGFFSGSEFSYSRDYSRGYPDTHGLHTLAELCLRRADMELESRNTKRKLGEGIAPFKFSEETLADSQSKRSKKTKRCDSTGEVEVMTAFNEDSANQFSQVDKINPGDKANQNLFQEEITKGIDGSRLRKLEDELEKMLQGREDIIGREMKEFMENNKLIIKDIARDTGLSTTEVSKFLTEGLHLKEEKRRKLFTWYLEKKLSCPVNPEDESFTCYKCGKIFAYESYLARHVKYVCPDKTGRTWKCSYCSKAFQYPCYLRRHMRSHTGESPYKCNQCSRAFVRSTDLQRHLRNHTGEKPYKCQECSRAFARSTDLKRHFRTHTGEKPYKCWQCSKAFSQSGSLQTHLHTHFKESLQVKGVIPSRIKHNTM